MYPNRFWSVAKQQIIVGEFVLDLGDEEV